MTAAFLPRHRFPPILSLPAGRIGAANILALVFERLGNGRNWKRGPSRTGYKRDLAGWLRVVRQCWRCGGDHAERYLRYAIGHHRIDLFNNRASWPEVEATLLDAINMAQGFKRAHSRAPKTPSAATSRPDAAHP